MSRFFFNIYDQSVSIDEEGIELADAEMARGAALAGARAMMCEELKSGRLSLDHRIEVKDEGGGAILILPFGDAVEIKRAA